MSVKSLPQQIAEYLASESLGPKPIGMPEVAYRTYLEARSHTTPTPEQTVDILNIVTRWFEANHSYGLADVILRKELRKYLGT